MSMKENAKIIAENVPKVYEAGQKAERDAFWDIIQLKGNRTDYANAFASQLWGESMFVPKYDIRPNNAKEFSYRSSCSGERVDMVQLEKQQGIIFDFSNATNLSHAFAGGLFRVINVVDTASVTALLYTFYGGYNSSQRIERVERLILHRGIKTYEGCFGYASDMEYIGFEGEIASNISLSACTKLEKQCLLALFNCLVDYSADTSGTTHTVTIGAENIAKVTDEEKAIATQKGWTIA